MAKTEYYSVIQVCMKSTTLKMFEFELEQENKNIFKKKSASKILFERLEKSYKDSPPKNYKV